MTITPIHTRRAAVTLVVGALLGIGVLAGGSLAGATVSTGGGYGAPHVAGASPHGTGPTLTRSILTVTDEATGATTTANSDSVTLATGCGNRATFFCLALGSDAFSVTTGTPLQAGQDLTDPVVSFNVGGALCGMNQSFNTDLPVDYSSSVEVDQFASDLSTMALQVSCTNSVYGITGTIALNAGNTTPHQGYYLYDSLGNTYGFGNDSYLTYLGNPGTLTLNQPIVGMATTASGGGYWMTASDGGVFAYGDAGFYGSAGSLQLNQPIVGMAATSDGKGYWFVAADGGIFAYGDATFYGSMGSDHLNQPIVGMASTPDGKGYWLVAGDGGIFAFGDAAFYGSTGNLQLNQPIVGMTSTGDGKGYWFVAADGGVFAYGDAQFHGSAGSTPLNEPITGMRSSPDGGGYLLVADDGGIFTYGDAPFYGSLGGQGISGVVGAAA
jgi:hypothetical protein